MFHQIAKVVQQTIESTIPSADLFLDEFDGYVYNQLI